MLKEIATLDKFLYALIIGTIATGIIKLLAVKYRKFFEILFPEIRKPQDGEAVQDDKAKETIFSKLLSIFALLFFFVILAFTGNLIFTSVEKYISMIDNSKYGFEDSPEVGWIVSKDSLHGIGMTEPGRNFSKKIKGKASMSVHVELNGSVEGREAGRHQGEVFVDPRFIQPKGYPANLQFLDLSDKTLSATVIVPKDLVRQKGNPSYFQLFVEECDKDSTRHTSDITKIISAGNPTLEFKINTSIKAICKLGLKIGLNDDDTNKYKGNIYIDAVDWKTAN